LEKIGEIQTSLALITQTQNHIQTDAQETRQDLDTLIADHSPCTTLAQAKNENNTKHSEMKQRIIDMETKCALCPVQDFKDLSDKMERMELSMGKMESSTEKNSETLSALVTSLTIVTYKVGHFPLWLIFLAVVLLGTIDLMYRHKDWVIRIMGW